MSTTVQSAPRYTLSNQNAISFAPGLSTEQQEAVLNTTLYATISANKEISRVVDPVKWFKSFVSTLGQLGWVTQSSDVKSFEEDTEETLVSLIKRGFSADDQRMIDGLLKRLAVAAKNNKKNTIKQLGIRKDSEMFWRFSIVTKTADGTIQLTLSAVYFQRGMSDLDDLAGELTSKKRTWRAQSYVTTMTLNWNVYEQVKDPLQEKLSKIARKFAANLDI